MEPPSTQVDFMLNDDEMGACPAVSEEFATAQVNALRHAALTREFIVSRQPDFTGLDFRDGNPITILVLSNSFTPGIRCNAFYSHPDVLVFIPGSCEGSDCCVNTAYASWVTHEYGHFFHHELGGFIRLGAFWEGFSDSLSILRHNDPVFGRDWKGSGTAVRDISATDAVYGCYSPVFWHECGQLLARTWWNIKLKLEEGSALPAEGLKTARQLFTAWAMITGGDSFTRGMSAIQQTGIEVLTVDDDDGDLSNGTPHVCAISWALADRGIPIPDLLPDENENGIPDYCDCTQRSVCNDQDVCTCDTCSDGICLAPASPYGDIDCSGYITLWDLFCILDGFAGDFSNCTLNQDDIHGDCAEGPPCCPNGVINLSDLFASLDAFGGYPACCTDQEGACCIDGVCSWKTPEECALNNGSFQGGAVPCELVQCVQGDGFTGGMEGPAGGEDGGGSITLLLIADPASGPPDTVFEVDVYGKSFTDLRGYELAATVSGGTSGALNIEELRADDPTNFVFHGLTNYPMFDTSVPRLACGLETGGVSSFFPKYLGTFAFRASQDAGGTFAVALVPGDGVTGTLALDSAGQAMTVSVRNNATIDVTGP